MNKLSKKILSGVLAFAMIATSAVALSGCKDKEQTNPNDVPSLEGLSPYSYSQDGKPNGYYKNEYDNKNQCIETKNYTTKGTYLGKTERTYDENGNVTVVTNYDSEDNISYKLTYEFDDQNREIKCSTLNDDGSIKSYTERTYDGDFQTEWKNCNADGSIIQRYTYESDENGNCVKITRYGAGDKLDSYTTYEDKDGMTYEKTYDANDNLIDEDSYESQNDTASSKASEE